ncbi:MAG: hypothetical protein DRQ88_03140 [Epsilonproteobacteria bacterium]|nr:MAG: hypothetical protein DRQ89_13315 [Campylobacterota bacterium]RLA67467.1 MAG: hypothetical protein DRQ88_03140 [Campylobacterota bacterium]
MSKQFESSVVHKEYKYLSKTEELDRTPKKQFSLGTYTGIIPFLIFVFFLIKTFIYIKDPKRHGK